MSHHLNNKNLLVIIAVGFLMICGLFSTMGNTTQVLDNSSIPDPMETDDDNSEVDSMIIEGIPVFVPSSAGNDYVDSVTSLTYGAHSTLPPSGMGADDTSYTVLNEDDLGWQSLLTQSTFSSKPSGWSDSNIGYSGRFGSNGISTSGYIYCPSVDTSSYSQVEFTINALLSDIFNSHEVITVTIAFYDSSDNWDDMDTIPMFWDADRTVTTTAAEYRHSQFKVRISYSLSFPEDAYFSADNWRISGYNEDGAFQAVYQFWLLDHNTYTIEELWVDFAAISSSEYLAFRFEATDTSPDDVVRASANDDFHVNVHTELTGTVCYLDIRDVDRTDSDHDTWRINRVYIKLTNSVPTNDQAPSCSNLDDTDNLYARSKYYEITTVHSDSDGFLNIDHVDLQCWDNLRTTMYWSVTFDEDTSLFSELSDPNGYITFDADSSSEVRNGNSLTVTFDIMINWNHPDLANIDLRTLVYDADSASDTDFHELSWDVETRLEFNDYDLDDGSGNDARGDLNGNITALGIIEYYGGTAHPPSDQIDVYVICPAVATSSWEATYVSADGSFETIVQADDEVGQDAYEFRVVIQGTGASGTNLIFATHAYGYQADRVNVTLLDSTAYNDRTNVSDSVNVFCHLEYEYDGGSVTDGNVIINGTIAIHQGSGVWSIAVSESTVTSHLFENITYSGGVYGLTGVNQNSKSTTVIWDEIAVRGYTSSYSRVNVSTQVQLNVTLEYEFDDSFVTDGIVELNGYSATYLGSGIWSISITQSSVSAMTFNLVSCSENNLAITSVNQNSQSHQVIWDRIIVLSMYSDDAENRTNIDDIILISCSLRYEFDNSYVNSGTVTVNGYTATGGTNGIWEISVSSSIVDSIVFDSIFFSGGPYDVSTVFMDGMNITIVWDGIEIYNLGAPSWALIDESFDIWFNARLAYDNHPLGSGDTLAIDDEIATWNGTHFIITRSYGTSGTRLFFVNSTTESSFDITEMAMTQEIQVQITNKPLVSSMGTSFTPSDALYNGVLDLTPFWFQWDPVNDPVQPIFSFTIAGLNISSWNITSSWSASVVLSGSTSGEHEYQIESGLDYTLGNHTYFIHIENEGGYTGNYTVYVTVRDYTQPTVSQPDDFTYELGSIGNNITWDLSDVHPGLYDIVGNGTDDVLDFGWSWTNGDIVYNVDDLSPGTYNFTIVVQDDGAIDTIDTVFVTVEDTTAPEITHPSDITITVGATGIGVSWFGSDLAPDSYEILLNGAVVKSGNWNTTSEMIEYSLDGFATGGYMLLIRLFDESGNSVSDTVIVTVEEDTSTTGTTPTETTPTDTTTTGTIPPAGDPMVIVLVIVGASGAIIAIIIIIIIQKKKG